MSGRDAGSNFPGDPGVGQHTNLTDGVLGNDVESREDFEARRRASVAQNSLGSVPSVRGAVLNVPGLLDAFVTENPFGEQTVVGGQILVPNSLYVAAVGGDAMMSQRRYGRRRRPAAITTETPRSWSDQGPASFRRSLPIP